MQLFDIKVTSAPLSEREWPQSDSDGAVVDFFGVVRNRESGRSIDGIEYEAFVLMAESQMEKIARSAMERFSASSVVLHHRIGFVPAGEVSLFLRVCTPHRGPAFTASQWIVEQLKALVPIWKHPVYAA